MMTEAAAEAAVVAVMKADILVFVLFEKSNEE